MLEFSERPKTPEMTSKKILLSLKGISCLQVIFVLIWMRRDKRWYGPIYKEMELEMDCLTFKETLAESLLEQMSVLHQSMSIFQSSRLVSQFHMMAGQNVKKKYLMRQIPIKMLKQHATPNSSLHNLKIYSSKGYRKTSQRWIYVACSSKNSNFHQKILLQTMGFCFDWWILLLLTLRSITQCVTK